ncbi:MAG TPA: hypothetical protein ENI87_06185 [bacterium]|nr:hypothetical protein [bacterium]
MKRLGLLAGLMLLAHPRAQEATITHSDREGRGIVTARVLLSGGVQFGIGLGFARVELTNHDQHPHQVEVTTESWSRRVGVGSSRTLVLEPGTQRFFLPVHVPPTGARCQIAVDGDVRSVGVGYDRSVVPLVSDRSGTIAPGTAVIEAMPNPSGIAIAPLPLRSEDVPRDWRQLTAFPAVMVDGVTPLDGERQEALRRYAFAGGVVIVAGADRLPAGPLQERMVRLDSGIAASGHAGHGFGHLVAIPPLGQDLGAMRARVAALPPLDDALLPAAYDLFQEQEIAGLGRAPVTVFVLVILLFAILVGPVNFLVLRRRRQPLLSLVTVPVLGFGTTLCILAYGILHDGFGVRGVVTSCTVLDQVRHEAATVSARTLFAGLAPSDLAISKDSLLLSLRAASLSRSATDRWQWDGDRERLDGAVLPSRTVTPLVSLQQGTVRARLTVRRVGDELEVLPDGGIEPVGRIVLRDLDGDYWVGRSAGNAALQLNRVEAAVGEELFRELRERSRKVVLSTDVGPRDRQMPAVMSEWGAPGSYATAVRAAPWIDEHGLDVAYDASAHYVFGRMHSQDFVR